MSDSILQFGTKLPDVTYVDRPGAYGIVFNNEGKILVIDEEGEYYLPGGGIDPGETHEQALAREFIEESGVEVASPVFICSANQYVDAAAGHFNKLGQFYHVQMRSDDVMQQVDGEVPKWVDLEEYFQKRVYEAQAWAVRNVLKQRGEIYKHEV